MIFLKSHSLKPRKIVNCLQVYKERENFSLGLPSVQPQGVDFTYKNKYKLLYLLYLAL